MFRDVEAPSPTKAPSWRELSSGCETEGERERQRMPFCKFDGIIVGDGASTSRWLSILDYRSRRIF